MFNLVSTVINDLLMTQFMKLIVKVCHLAEAEVHQQGMKIHPRRVSQ